jgi:hypothetical protein
VRSFRKTIELHVPERMASVSITSRVEQHKERDPRAILGE